MTRSRMLTSVGVLACLLVLPTAARAQSAFAGVVKDVSGAVLPGVVIEASSPALIEGARSVSTDGNGAYKIENLRPGIYTLSFGLPGFSTVKRAGVELLSNFTATINAELRVSAVEETITVNAESPVVDVQSNTKAQVLSRDMLDAVPSAHTIQSVGQLVVGVALTAPDVGGSQAMQQTYFTVHGLGAAQTTVMIDGMIVNGLQGDGAIQSYLNEGANQEMVYQTGGGTVDSPTGGVKINLVPKEGGNLFSGSLFEGYESSSLQANNLTANLAAGGVKTVDKIGKYSDTDFTQGGPLKRDKLWFFGSVRFFTVNKPIANTIVSDGTPAGIAACQAGLAGKGPLCPQGVDPQHQYSGLGRVTWQISPRNKLAGYYDRVHKARGAAMVVGDDQTTSSVVWNSPMYTTNSIKWTSTVSNRLLIEGGFSSNIERYNNLYQPGLEHLGTIFGARHVDAGAGYTWAASAFEYGSYPDRYNLQASASYVTGTNSIKIGFQDSMGHYNQNAKMNADLYQNYTQVAGVETPQTVTIFATPARWEESLNANLGVYGQDSLTLKRLTLTFGGRWEYVSEQVDGQAAQVGRFANIPAFSTIPMPKWYSFSPRTGAVYDLLGDGKTAVKFGFNRYEAAATTTLASLYDPAAGSGISTTLPWQDLNGNDVAEGVPGCVFLIPGCEINFANRPSNFGTVSLANPDPGLTRPYVYQYNTGLTREVLRGMSVSFDWFHTVSKNFMERNNINRPGTYAGGTVTNASYRPFTVFSPIDGAPLTLYDIANAAVGTTAATLIDSNDSNLTQKYDAFEFGVNARLPHEGRLSGGFGTDRTIANTCSAAANNPNFLISVGGTNYCDQRLSGIPWRTGVKVVGTFPLPLFGLIVSGSYQGLPGYILGTAALTSGGAGAPNFALPSGAASVLTVTGSTRYAQCPGSSAAAGCVVGGLMAPGMLSSLNVPLAPPGTVLTPRLNQVDLSIAKRITIGRLKIDPKIDIFNALNSDAYFTTRSTTFTPIAAGATPTGLQGSGGSFLQPGSIIQGRLLRIAAVVNW